jgi:hypothetical protein
LATDLSRDDLRRLARLGALSRLAELRKEEAAIRAAFPDLFRGGGRGKAAGTAAQPARRARKRRKMSSAEKKAVSERMKKYWAERRKAR